MAGPDGTTAAAASCDSSKGGRRFTICDPRASFVAQVQARVKATKARGLSLFQDCYVITNKGIYLVKLDKDPVTAFLESAIQGDIKTAERMSSTFNLDNR